MNTPLYGFRTGVFRRLEEECLVNLLLLLLLIINKGA